MNSPPVQVTVFSKFDGHVPELCHGMDSSRLAVSKLQGKTERRLPLPTVTFSLFPSFLFSYIFSLHLSSCILVRLPFVSRSLPFTSLLRRHDSDRLRSFFDHESLIACVQVCCMYVSSADSLRDSLFFASRAFHGQIPSLCSMIVVHIAFFLSPFLIFAPSSLMLLP